MTRVVAHILGMREVTDEIDARLIAAVGEVFSDDFSYVRFWQVQPGTLADRVARWYGPKAAAFAWTRHVIFPVGSEGAYCGLNQILVPAHANTLAHELWHVRDARRAGLLRFGLHFLRELRRRGLAGMVHAPHEVAAREAAARFVASARYAALVEQCRAEQQRAPQGLQRGAN
ncbi:MAG: hypothetical protein AB7Y46_05360 [Armatimonadota bacterium]